jgi:predicted PurR-regulated permease PerM
VSGATLVPREPEPTLAQQVVRAVVGLAALVAVGACVYALRFLLVPVGLAFLLRYFLLPLVDPLEDRGLPRWAAVLLCFSALLGAGAAVGAAVWPSLESWLRESPAPGERSVFELQLEQRLREWEASGRRLYPQVDWHSASERALGFLEEQRRKLMETLPLLALEALSQVGTLALAPIVAFFLLLDGVAMHRALVAWVPNRYFETVLVLLHRVDRQIASYLRGAASECALVAALVSLVLWAVGMPSAILLGCLYGVLVVIPLVGPLLGASAGLLYALVSPEAPGLGVLAACYAAVHVVDALLINPLVVGRSVNLHPLAIILGLSMGGGLAGPVGMLVSVPTLAVGRAIVSTLREAYQRGQLRRVG